jgi:hypothetical protein
VSATVAINVLLWAAAVAAAAWIVVPAIAFALNIGGLRTDIVPDAGPPTVYTADSVFGPRLGELAALGFRMESRTRERGRFISPIHWTWESYEAQQWLVSPDGLTHATLYRLADGEPARISFVTRFEDGGMVRTSCPGSAAKETTRPNYWRFDVRGVDAATLLARHQEQVEAFARERGTKTKEATVSEIAAADNAAEWPILRKMSVSSYGIMGLLLLPAPFVFLLLVPVRALGNLAFPPIAVCLTAGFYALLRWFLVGPNLRTYAKLSHTRDLSEEVAPALDPDDVGEDGRILANGKNERRLRTLAVVTAILSCVWPVIWARELLVYVRERPGVILGFLVLFPLSALLLVRLAGRARGKMVWQRKGHRDPAGVWAFLLLLNFFFMIQSKPASHHFVWIVAATSFLLGLIGWTLEKKRGQ